MSGLTWLLRAIRDGRSAADAEAPAAGAAAAGLTRDLAVLHDAVAGLQVQTAALHRQLDRLTAIRAADATAPAQLDRLERLLDRDRVAAHVRGALAGAVVVDEPVAHLVVHGLLPEDVYAAALETVPPALFFDGNGNRARELKLPPALAPLTAIVAWTFLTDVLDDVCCQLLMERVRAPLVRRFRELYPSAADLDSVTLSAGGARIVRRGAGSTAPAARQRPWHVLAMVLDLARPGDGAEYGHYLAGGSLTVPFRPNTALVVVDADMHAYAAVPESAAADVQLDTYEVRFGPDAASRRRLE